MSGSGDRSARIETYTGQLIDVLDPSPAAIDLEDVAAGLAHTCRFGGHCSQFYSVAQHSLYVSRELPSDQPRLQLLGLLHDAGEAYVGDVPRPLKGELEGFERIEDRVLEAVWEGLDVQPPTQREWERVMEADDRLLAYEAAALLSDGSWAADPPELEYDLEPASISTVRERFLTRAEQLLAAVEE
ncbi:hypothetical protein [Halopiger goleimassiliensis]|uniref:hypothetical protein n=1 Tax=Halopiger goleimassiliensis TaxID=1293048 RepID=UPI0006780171|nr:hypothetical protein [Halopiger goleimassiliensis]